MSGQSEILECIVPEREYLRDRFIHSYTQSNANLI